MRLMWRHCVCCHGKQRLESFDGHILWYRCRCGVLVGVVR